ncbi:MAG: serine/threonine protein kinase, partial [Muribaculaceae bacterium]|nr:serine/threonine protein kinase [Muribaculaceae bacterium]
MNDSDLREGLLINNRYELKRYLGSGSFGEVWLAWDNVLRMDLAIKMYISLDQNGQDEFKDEYRVAYGLREEHLLTADYYGVWNHRPFLTMKYCERGSTAALAGKADEITIWHFLHDVAAGLRHLHGIEPPILHQDIKPENILNDESGRFLITDFGISRKMRSTMRKQSKRSIGSGALAYMGPERFTNDPMAVKASDIWSLGVSAYELATGDLPFMGQGGGMLLGGAQLPDIDKSKFSNQLNEIIKACMAKETWERPTAEQLVEYTDDVLAGSKLTWKKWLKAHKKGGKNSGSRTPMYITLGIIGLIALAAGIYFFLKNPEKPVAHDDEQLIQSRYT